LLLEGLANQVAISGPPLGGPGSPGDWGPNPAGPPNRLLETLSQHIELGIHGLRSWGRNWSRKVRETRSSSGVQGHEGGRGVSPGPPSISPTTLVFLRKSPRSRTQSQKNLDLCATLGNIFFVSLSRALILPKHAEVRSHVTDRAHSAGSNSFRNSGRPRPAGVLAALGSAPAGRVPQVTRLGNGVTAVPWERG